MEKIKYYILKYYYFILTKLRLYKPMTANRIKENFLKNIDKLPKWDFTTKEAQEAIQQAQLNMIKERYNKLIYDKEKNS